VSSIISKETAMAFLGHLEFKDERNPSQTTTLVLLRCLEGTGKDIETFLKGLSIDPMAFFIDINADWHRRGRSSASMCSRSCRPLDTRGPSMTSGNR
jgi:hypothetical protein